MTILLSWCFTATETIRLIRDGFVTMSREGAAGQVSRTTWHKDRVERGFENKVGEWGAKGEGTRKAEIPRSKRCMHFNNPLQTKVRPPVKSEPVWSSGFCGR